MAEGMRLKPFDKRIHEIDLVRGFLIILVIMDHLFITLGNYAAPSVWNVTWMYEFFYCWYFKGILREVIQPTVLMLFCFVSGVSCIFSRNNLKRGIETIVVALAICGLTHLMQALVDWGIWGFLEGYFIIDFNIIGVLGISMVVYALIEKRSWKALGVVILISYLFSSFIIPNLRENLFDIFGGVDCTQEGILFRPGAYYRIPKFIIPFFWEPVYGDNLLTSDYVPLFPYMGLFFCGALFAYFFYKEKRQSLIPHKGSWEKPICFLGRHTLIIYFGQIITIVALFAAIDGLVNLA